MSSVSDLVGADDDDEQERTDDFIVSVGDLDASDAAEGAFEPSEPFAHRQKVQEIRAQYRRHETDTGSPEYQVAGMTERIAYLSGHLKIHPKDFSTRRGLVAMVNKRRRLLNYLFVEDVKRYLELVSSLGIRHKPPGRVESREEKYANFPAQKVVKKHLIKKKEN